MKHWDRGRGGKWVCRVKKDRAQHMGTEPVRGCGWEKKPNNVVASRERGVNALKHRNKSAVIAEKNQRDGGGEGANLGLTGQSTIGLAFGGIGQGDTKV